MLLPPPPGALCGPDSMPLKFIRRMAISCILSFRLLAIDGRTTTGGSFENRIRLLLEVVNVVRKEMPAKLALMVRISATDWAEGGWDIDQSVALAKILKTHQVDLMDISSGGLVPYAKIPAGSGFQTPFADRIRREAGVPTGAVGFITGAAQADHIIRTGQADVVLIAREFLRDPYWPLQAAVEVHQKIAWPKQYLRAAAAGTTRRNGIPDD